MTTHARSGLRKLIPSNCAPGVDPSVQPGGGGQGRRTSSRTQITSVSPSWVCHSSGFTSGAAGASRSRHAAASSSRWNAIAPSLTPDWTAILAPAALTWVVPVLAAAWPLRAALVRTVAEGLAPPTPSVAYEPVAAPADLRHGEHVLRLVHGQGLTAPHELDPRWQQILFPMRIEDRVMAERAGHVGGPTSG